MRKVEIKLPQSIRECNPDQMAKWMLLTEGVQLSEGDLLKSLDFQCQVLSIFSGMPMAQIRKFHIDDVIDAARSILEMLANYNHQEPNEKIDINGQVYCFDKDVSGWSTGQIIDLKLIEDVASNPSEALAIMYIEEGMEYCQEDSRGKVLNPNKKREEIFKQHFPGDEFMNFFTFFLSESQKRKNAISAIQIARMMNQREEIEKELSETLNGSRGRSYFSGFQRRWRKILMKSPGSRT